MQFLIPMMCPNSSRQHVRKIFDNIKNVLSWHSRLINLYKILVLQNVVATYGQNSVGYFIMYE